jgi:hypothetical protein
MATYESHKTEIGSSIPPSASKALLRHAKAVRQPRPQLQLRRQYAPGLFGFERAKPRPRAESLRDGFWPVVFPEKLAARLNRPQKLVDNWIPVPIPDVLARAFGCGSSLDAGRALLRERLARLCEWLDARLEEPPVIIDELAGRLVMVFHCVGYRVDFVGRRVSAARIFPSGSVQELSFEVELMKPLFTGFWLRWVLDDLRLGINDGQRALFVTTAEAKLHDDWLIQTAWKFLKADLRFQWLRKRGLPEALSLHADLLALATHSRTGARGMVPRSTFNLVWQHEMPFRRVARENPQLLNLLELSLREKTMPHEGDPIAEIRNYFRKSGLSDAAWRYLHRCGSRLFDIPIAMSTNLSKLPVCKCYLGALEAAGFPPPPAPALLRAWLRCFVIRGEDRLLFTRHWYGMHPTVIRAVLLEGDARRTQPDFADFVADAAGVMQWGLEVNLVLNKQQARAGWAWLRRNWIVWQEKRQHMAGQTGRRWQSLLSEHTNGTYKVVPLTSSSALLEEAIAMRHCVDTYESQCVQGIARIFSIRCAETGKRLATLGILAIGEGAWTIYDFRGTANRPVPAALRELGWTVAQEYSARQTAGCRPLNSRLPKVN